MSIFQNETYIIDLPKAHTRIQQLTKSIKRTLANGILETFDHSKTILSTKFKAKAPIRINLYEIPFLKSVSVGKIIIDKRK